MELCLSLLQQSSLWMKADGGCWVCRYDFDEREQEVAELKKLSKQSVLTYFQRFVAPSSRVRRRLAVHVVGRTHQAEIASPAPSGVELIGDMSTFRAGLELFEPEGKPLPQVQNV